MAYNFNGTTQYLSGSTPITAVPLTLACWFNSNSDTTAQVLVQVGVATTFTRSSVAARGDVAGDPVRATQGGVGTVVADTTLGYSITTWTHAAAANASSTSTKAYINGGNIATNTTNVGSANNYQIFRIAANESNNIISQYMDGIIAEAAIWNVGLTNDEITSLSKGFKPSRIRPQSLVFYAPLIRDLQDTKGALAITNNNTATVAVHPRVI